MTNARTVKRLERRDKYMKTVLKYFLDRLSVLDKTDIYILMAFLSGLAETTLREEFTAAELMTKEKNRSQLSTDGNGSQTTDSDIG